MSKQPIHNLDELIRSIKRGKAVKFTKYDEIPFQTWLTDYLQKTEANFYHEYTKNGYTFFNGNAPVIMLFPEKDGTIGWTW
ncbi:MULTISPECIES: hypothetical protein [Burkholderiaceae]|jgi:hypothetical protein|uniref:Uncharacterized protein n=2 Tax=Burkholderiaceae TaxID=119060 RepID=A0A6J5JHH0_9BURK|nr:MULTISPECIES: hypothetical protein [Burkholderiaceae]ANJ73110.1 hypothetical protein A9Y76_11780 [Ralstonia insidiosa]KAB0601824.1 hypothetical protein F7R19_15095 [Cupriavidus pauculus]MBR8498396.1 hypothetical protein [Burkholderia cenocepacia]UAL00255.1 hypothetical protein K8O84_02440 [Cupriavidus pauculus]CAB3970765.1 hypothetical protein BLA3211_06108 [Burkholderia aenigmatica]